MNQPQPSPAPDASASQPDASAGAATQPATAPRVRTRSARGCLTGLALALAVTACGGSGGGNGGGGNGGGGGDGAAPLTTTPVPGSTPNPTPAPPPSPKPDSTPVPVADTCASSASAAGPGSAGEAPSQLGASFDVYAACQSVYQGQRISFHLADYVRASGVNTQVPVTITRIGMPSADDPVYIGSASMTRQPVPGDAWVNCCNWPVGLDLRIPLDWPSGYYRASFSNPGAETSHAMFVVKNRTPMTGGKVFQIPFDTMQAYNPWGGKSAYEFSSTNAIRARRLSLIRPTPGADDPDFIIGIIPFIRWAESQGIQMDYLASADMLDANVLAPWKVFITVGHDEYWSTEMRAELDRHVDSGRHAAIFSGNTMWWKTDHQSDAWGRARGRMLVERQNGSSTPNWITIDPEARSIGATFFRGGFLNKFTGAALGNRPYTVHRPEHWAFAGTGFTEGTEFGANVSFENNAWLSIHAYESDGLDFRFNAEGRPIPTPESGAPPGTQILATTSLPAASPPEAGWDVPADNGSIAMPPRQTGEPGGWATMTTFTRNNGIVFNVGTTDYYKVLPACTGGAQTPACRVVRNVLDHMQTH